MHACQCVMHACVECLVVNVYVVASTLSFFFWQVYAASYSIFMHRLQDQIKLFQRVQESALASSSKCCCVWKRGGGEGTGICLGKVC